MSRAIAAGELGDVGRRLRGRGLVDEVAGPQRPPPRCGRRARARRAPWRRPSSRRARAPASTPWPPTCSAGTGSCRAPRLRRRPARPARGRRRARPRRAASSRPPPRAPRAWRAPHRPAGRSRVERVGVADSEQERGLRAQVPAGRDREHLAALALEVGLAHEVGERAAERVVDELGPRARTARR